MLRAGKVAVCMGSAVCPAFSGQPIESLHLGDSFGVSGNRLAYDQAR